MKTTYLILILFVFALTSCGVDRVYVSATYGSIKPHTEKPIFKKEYKKNSKEENTTESNTKSNTESSDNNTANKETTKNQVYTYFSGNVSDGYNHQNDTKFITSFDLYRSYARKNLNFYYGGGGSFGTYRFGLPYPNLIEAGEEQSFGSVNLKAGANIVTHSRFIEFRFIGFELLYNYEFGEYQRKIATIPIVDSTVVLAQNSMFSFTIYSEYTLKFTSKTRLTFGFYGGNVVVDTSQNADIDATFVGLNLSYTYHKYTVYYIREDGQANMGSKKFGVVYRF